MVLWTRAWGEQDQVNMKGRRTIIMWLGRKMTDTKRIRRLKYSHPLSSYVKLVHAWAYPKLPPNFKGLKLRVPYRTDILYMIS